MLSSQTALLTSAVLFTGVQCEEPFALLPLQALCEMVKLDVSDALRDATAQDFSHQPEVLI